MACPYNGDRVLGQGTYGKVILVTDESSSYALKTVQYEDRIINVEEIDIMSRLDHPNLIRSLAIVPPQLCNQLVAANGLGFLLPLAKGDLGSLLSQFTFEERVKYLFQIGSAIKFMHDNHCLHLDIKPQNCLLDQDNNAVLADPGLSLYVNNINIGTLMKGIYGTPVYMAPEILSLKVILTNKVDVWAYGMMAFIMLSNELPTAGGRGDLNKTLEIINNFFGVNASQNILSLLKAVPRNYVAMVHDFLVGMLKLDPDQRYDMNRVLHSELFRYFNYNVPIPGQIVHLMNEDGQLNAIQVNALKSILQEVKSQPQLPLEIYFLAIDLMARSLYLFPNENPIQIAAAAALLALMMHKIRPKLAYDILPLQQKIVTGLRGVLNNNFIFNAAKNLQQLESIQTELKDNLQNYLNFNIDRFNTLQPLIDNKDGKYVLIEQTIYSQGL